MTNSLISLDKSRIEKDYLIIRSLINLLNSKIANETKSIEITIIELEKEVPSYVTRFKALETEVGILRSKLNLKSSNDEFLNTFDIDNFNESTIDLKNEIKRLYRLISSKCHPDKTSNKDLNELFISATEAYNNYNYTMLLDIYSKIINESDLFIDKQISIEDRLKLIQEEYDKRKIEYDTLTSTYGYRIKTLIESKLTKDNYLGRKLFLDLLFTKILEFETLKHELENNLNDGLK